MTSRFDKIKNSLDDGVTTKQAFEVAKLIDRGVLIKSNRIENNTLILLTNEGVIKIEPSVLKWERVQEKRTCKTYKYGEHELSGFQYNWFIHKNGEFVNSFKKKKDSVDFIESLYN